VSLVLSVGVDGGLMTVILVAGHAAWGLGLSTRRIGHRPAVSRYRLTCSVRLEYITVRTAKQKRLHLHSFTDICARCTAAPVCSYKLARYC
jgi:hypothetical protein